MLLVLGVTVAVTVLGVRAAACQRCGQYGEHEITERVRRLSVFFIPMLRLGPAKYADVCTVCGWATPLSADQARGLAGRRPFPGPQDAPSPQDSPTWPPAPQDR